MSLNIKNPRTHELVRELASVLQVSQTEAVTAAVEDLLRRERHSRGKQLAEIRKTATQIRSHTKEFANGLDDELYDEEGLYA